MGGNSWCHSSPEIRKQRNYFSLFFFNSSGSLPVVSDMLIMFVEGEDIKDDENFSSLWCESS